MQLGFPSQGLSEVPQGSVFTLRCSEPPQSYAKKKVVWNRVCLFENQFFNVIFQNADFSMEKNMRLSSSIPLFLRQRIFCHFFRSFSSSFFLRQNSACLLPSLSLAFFVNKKLSDFYQGWPFPRISMPDPARPGPAPHCGSVPGSTRPGEIRLGPALACVGLAAPAWLTVCFQFVI